MGVVLTNTLPSIVQTLEILLFLRILFASFTSPRLNEVRFLLINIPFDRQAAADEPGKISDSFRYLSFVLCLYSEDFTLWLTSLTIRGFICSLLRWCAISMSSGRMRTSRESANFKVAFSVDKYEYIVPSCLAGHIISKSHHLVR